MELKTSKRNFGNLHAVGDDSANASPDPYETLVPEVTYQVSFVSEEKFSFYKSQKWAVKMKIVDGPQFGKLLFWFFPIPQLRRGRTPSAKLSRVYEIATGRRSPKRIAAHRPSSFLKGCIFEVEVRDVKQDVDGTQRPAACRYSVVHKLIRRLAGTPNCLGKVRK